jgi:hypothetical protein
LSRRATRVEGTMPTPDVKDLETRGFVVVPSFLSDAEVRRCREDFERQPVDANNHNYSLSGASSDAQGAVTPRVQELLALVSRTTSLSVDLPLGAAYFATGRGISFSWHQDHESFFTIQNHYDYLNFYIPIVKPRRDKSNLSIVPFDVLERASPRGFAKLVRGGATRFPRIRGGRMVFFDDSGSVLLMSEDLNRLAHTPELGPGDLLLLRGDMIHSTQDTETERVSLSFRAARKDTTVRRSRLAAGSLYKVRMMVNNAATYERMFRTFDVAGEDAIAFYDLASSMHLLPQTPPRRPAEFFRYLIREKARAHVLSPFVRRTLTTVLADRAVSLDERFRRQPAAAS